jgi:hypothetical protein
VKRVVSLSGNYFSIFTSNLQKSELFSFNNVDTVDYSDLETFETQSFPFTKSIKPAEPFLSSLIEPIIAICTAATIIYLFFTVRSK